MDPLCSSRVIDSRRDAVRATATARRGAVGRSVERYVHGHAVPLGAVIIKDRITVLSTLPEWRPAATGTYMQIRQNPFGP